nr:glucose-1-phosphate cytidylyltransferase [Pigmentibacter ruber]
MKVVIFCGGLGTRIRDTSESLPKPMINIGNYPILWHIMRYYAHWGHKEFILCLGYKGDKIREFFLNYRAYTSDFTLNFNKDNKDIIFHSNHETHDWSVTLVETGLNTMTGGRLKKVQKYITQDEPFLLTYGDGLGDINLDNLVRFHTMSNKILTVTGVRPPGRFGELNSDEFGTVTEFNEKPQATAGVISGGFFACNYKIFNYLNENDNLVFENEPIKALVKDQQMSIYKHEHFWQPMDTHREYLLLNEMYEKGNAPWMVWNK